MAIERLLYAQDSNPYELQYVTENGGECIRANVGIDQVFRQGENYVGGDCIITHNSISSFRMGWNTAAAFTIEGDHLKVKQVYEALNNVEKPDAEGHGTIARIKAGKFDQITTQAIDTCTLIYIETEKEYLLAHFVLSRMIDFVDTLKNISLGTAKKVFFSGWMDSEKDALDALKNQLNQAEFICFDRCIPPIDGNSQEKNYLAHFEFGIGWDRGTMTYFGDIVHMSDQTPLENSRRCCTFKCAQVSGLSDMETWAGALK